MLDDDVNNADDLKAAITEFEMVVAEDSRIRNGSYIRRGVGRRLIHLLDSKFYPLEERWELQKILINNWEKLKLTEAEEVVYGIGSETEMDVCLNNQIPLSLVWKLLTVEPFNVEAMKNTLLSIWRLQESDVIRMVETNLFVFQFFCEANKKRVMEGCPWSVADQILLLKGINNNEQPSEITFTTTPFWIRLLYVPFGKRNYSFAHDIGVVLGGFLKYDDSGPIEWEEFMRINVLLEIDKPLPRGIEIKLSPTLTKWFGFKYERQQVAEFETILQKQLVKIIDECKSVHVAHLALKVLGNVARWGNDYYNRDMINGGLLECILRLLKGDDRIAQNEACWIISNVTASSKLEVEL
ncbi:hypothetical protein POM88_006184 [Heracleum sosnowskyi]|uniref:DUF4283 domain-containing protein n=1 Tax=Heracleum sosnowskyi TaxID=360622 RepID=A0AAD8J311_9APIA|nr:hypothetical protein POM88_006184 [Heracleum sosnowskyi]